MLAAVLACGPAADEQLRVHDLRYLRVGADLDEEAEATSRNLERAGFGVRARVRGERFRAVGAAMPGDSATAVRVITRRGVVLALDAPGPHRAYDVFLSTAHCESRGCPPDPDGDGDEEVVIGTRDELYARRCLALVRVDGEGSVREVRIQLDEYDEALPTDACLEQLVDLDADGTFEGLARVRLPSLALGDVPLVPWVLGHTRDGSWGPVPARGFYADEIERREFIVNETEAEVRAEAAAPEARVRSIRERRLRALAELVVLTRHVRGARQARAALARLRETALGDDPPPRLQTYVQRVREYLATATEDEATGEDATTPGADPP